ncbi:MAG: 3-deoxy-D-manno-octulosonic acid kinase [Steroidobacteraceae bacterium]
MSLVVTGQGRSAMLHDPTATTDPGRLFDLESLAAAGRVEQVRGGRGSVSFLALSGDRFVLRRYLRGGLVARLSKDRYAWTGLERTRPFRELRLLERLQALGLPVPRPVAARVTRHGLTYSGELVTSRLPAAEPLGERWLAGRASEEDWLAAGRCVRRFHDAGVRHADLNANNIMVDGLGGVWLLDLDRGSLPGPGPWQRSVLQRLARSLRKLAADERSWEAPWELFMRGHGDAEASL